MMPNPKNLKKFRALTEETQDAFAEVLGFTKGNYCKKERGEVPITLEEAGTLTEHISKKLGRKVTVDEVFFSNVNAL